MKKFIITALCCGILGALFVWGCTKAIKDAKETGAAHRAERAAELALPLTEKEMDYWTEVYSAAVRRGVWYPSEVANNAVIELRKMGGGQE
jgi:hypothetical protein